MSKKGIAIILVIFIAIVGIFYFIKKTTSISLSSPQTIIPTSTSAPTPTSAYRGTQDLKQQTPRATSTITLTAKGFSPQTLTIKAGTLVIWVNNSGSQATVNSDPHPTHTAYPPLNLGQFNDGDSLQLLFNKPGRYGYHNHFDATQTGVIIVQ